ncbi:MAG: DUF2203 domain-containing protein [Candidatus Omnitrophica bacterium]|nr:DUF2203 domain-containing protein [Candidatus Omnitrophota bacterium]
MIQIKVFTHEEATAMIPELTGLITRLHALRDKAAGKEAEIDALELVSGTDAASKGSPAVNREIEALNAVIAEFNSAVDAIHEKGCFLKDIDLGLVDFYSLREGKVVYLCWKYGEPEIAHWHHVGEGYAHRHPLP